MSKDQGGRLVRQTSPRQSARPSLERPSLFAEMDSLSNVLEGDTQRVRILSTLESTRHATRLAPSSKRRRFTLALPKNWQLKALMGLMTLGVLTLLAAFALIVMNGHQVAGQADEGAPSSTQTTSSKSPDGPLKATMAAAKADRNNPLAALIAAPAASSATATLAAAPRAQPPTQPLAEQAAVIENIAPSITPTHASTTAPKAAIHVVLAAQSSQPPAMLAASAATSSTTRSIDATAYAVMTKPAKPAAKRAPPTSRHDEDVALLEAMFAHTGNRSSAPPLSAADEIKTRCNALSGAAAATCRARVCVQNPSAAVCHQDP